MKNLRKILEQRYGRAEYDFEGKKIAGILYGNDEMWESDKFYQELLSDDNKVYRCFFDVPESQDLEDIDYDKPSTIEDITDEAVRFYCETEDERLAEIADYIFDVIGETNYYKKLDLDFAEKLLVEKLGKEFYNDLGNLVTAKHESEYFLEYLLDEFEDIEGYKSFDSFLNYELENYTDGYLTVDEYLWNFCPVCEKHWDDIEGDCGHYTATMIKYYRLKNGWSIRDLAEKLGYEYHNTVTAWENGSRKPKLASIKKLAKVFEIDYINLIR